MATNPGSRSTKGHPVVPLDDSNTDPSYSRRAMLGSSAALAALLLAGMTRPADAQTSLVELALGDLPSGPIGTAEDTVDVWGRIGVAPTSPRGYQLPAPSNTGKVRAVTIVNRGSALVTVSGVPIGPGEAGTFNWSPAVRGRPAVWTKSGRVGDPNADFRVLFTATDCDVSVDDWDWAVFAGPASDPLNVRLGAPGPLSLRRTVNLKQTGTAPVRLIPPAGQLVDGAVEAVVLRRPWSAIVVTYIGYGGWLLS